MLVTNVSVNLIKRRLLQSISVTKVALGHNAMLQLMSIEQHEGPGLFFVLTAIFLSYTLVFAPSLDGSSYGVSKDIPGTRLLFLSYKNSGKRLSSECCKLS